MRLRCGRVEARWAVAADAPLDTGAMRPARDEAPAITTTYDGESEIVLARTGRSHHLADEGPFQA